MKTRKLLLSPTREGWLNLRNKKQTFRIVYKLQNPKNAKLGKGIM